MTTASLLLSAVAAAAIMLSASASGDYATQVEPAVRSLAHGHLARFFELQPAYGSLAALVQAPFVSLAVHLGGGPLAVYRAALFPCLVAVGLLGVALARGAHARGGSPPVCLAVCGLALVNPASLKAVELGHPEELLTAALALGALLAAGRGRAPAAAVLLGLALAAKQWALLAVPAVLLVSAPGRRLRVALGAGAVVVALTGPLALAEPRAFAGNARQSEGATLTVSRFSVWWALAHERTKVVRVAGQPRVVKLHRLSGGLTRTGRPLAVALAFALAAAAALKRRIRLEHGLAVLALALLLRCVLDPVDTSYYHVPFVLSLLAWESLRRRGAPLLTLLVSSALLATFGHGLLVRPALDNAFYLAWTLSVGALLAAWVYAPGAIERLLSGWRGSGRGAELAPRLPHASGT